MLHALKVFHREPDIRADSIQSAMSARGFSEAAYGFRDRWDDYNEPQRRTLFRVWCGS